MNLRFLISFLIFSIFFISNVSAQKIDAIWDLLHKNERAKALKLANKLDTETSLEALLTKAIVRKENGLLVPEENFIEKMMMFPEAEYYLYSHWFSPFIFGDYLDNGFDVYNEKAGEEIDQKYISNSTVLNSLHYFKGISARYRKNWELYTNELLKINSLRGWEYCGVFENLNNSGLATAYAPESNASLNDKFDTEGNGFVSWYETQKNDEVYKFFTNHLEYGNGVNYAQTFVTSSKSQRVLLKLGFGGLIKVFVNDVLVVQQDEDIVSEMDAITYVINLQEGANRIVVKSATEKQTPFFIVRLESEENTPLDNVTVDLTKRDYSSSTLEEVNPVKMDHSIINYFKNKQEALGQNYILDYSLIKAYLRNSQYDSALEIIDLWLERYPKSSTLLNHKSESLLGNEKVTRYNEIQKNIEVNDPTYYISVLADMQNTSELMKLDLEAFNKRLQEVSESVDYPYIHKAIELFKSVRTNDIADVRTKLDEVVAEPSFPSSTLPTFVQFYDQLLNDDASSIAVLEKLQKNTFSARVTSLLSQYYGKQNKIDQSLSVYDEILKELPDDNISLYKYITLLQSYNRYEESLPFIDKAIANFPDSYKLLQSKGAALQQIGKKKEAIKFYELALAKNGANRELRNLILDLKGEKDPLEQFEIDDLYSFIEKERGKITENNYGLNVLLDQLNVLKYEESGGRYKATYIYEVTSQQGVDELKEYDLGLYGNYAILKSEIVRKDKTIIPAERSGSNMVFNSLSVGDVILINYETSFSKSGRFYKTYQDTKSFSSYNPVSNKVYRVITDKKDAPLVFTFANGSLEGKEYTKGDYRVYEWLEEDRPMLAQYEDFMPVFDDVGTQLHISTVKNWTEISDWYSDLVRSQIVYDDTVKEAFDSIFPNGYKQLSEDERAQRIYEYITSTFSYSYVSFKQSGFVPQKPSKVIDTKLGDCKDFSTLFLTLGKQAELDANLVLILTSDYGEKSLILPSTDFNHCIIRVKIDGKYQYLELTSKYLPYKALPVSLIYATALEIPFSKGDMKNNDVKILNNLDRKTTIFASDATIEVGLDNSEIDLTTTTTGSLSTTYIEYLTENEGEEKLKQLLSDEIVNRNGRDLTLLSVDDKTFSSSTDKTSFTTTLRWNEKPNKIGSLKTLEVPYFTNPYNQSIINLETRKYPIRYISYENADVYEETITLKLEEGQRFIEVPENQSYSFKNHTYQVTYDRVEDGTLKVTTHSKTPFDDIASTSYPEFKKYVQNVLESRRQLIGFK